MSDDIFDLDFTKPTKPPTKAAVDTANKEARAGTPKLEEKGFFIPASRLPSKRIPPRDGVKYAILVIEDDVELLKLLGEVLTAHAFATRFARNRAEINAEFNKPPLPDLLLLDVSLPDADGFAILEKIRANPKIARIPVVMMTGRSEPRDVARGLALGADGYVTKPFRLAGLVDAINAILGKNA